jgi:N-acetylglucosamine-6-phosphate deacetylase
MDVVARHFETGEWTRLTIRDGRIAAIVPAGGRRGERDGDDDWIAPAFWDIQTNGRWGVSFSDPDLSVEEVVEIVHAQASLGTARVCPTLISASRSTMLHGVRTIAEACERYEDIASRVIGIHLEGPYLSELDGYRGAHPRDAVRDPDLAEFRTLQEQSGGRIAIVTLAPERAGSLEFIREVARSGVVVALGHTAADGPTLRAAVEAGARLCTHLGNGIAATLPRHPNPIWEQAAIDELTASLIADGHHLDQAVLRVLVRAKSPTRIILVSDASPLAGLPPGRYGDWEVDPSGKIVVAGTPYLAGSNQGLCVGLANLLDATDLALAEALATVTRNPARLLGRPEPVLGLNEPANLIIFSRSTTASGNEIRLKRTCVDGRWVGADAAERTAALRG